MHIRRKITCRLHPTARKRRRKTNHYAHRKKKEKETLGEVVKGNAHFRDSVSRVQKRSRETKQSAVG